MNTAQSPHSIEAYFNRLRMGLTIGLIIGFALPHLLLLGYFHIQLTGTLKRSGNVNLMAIAQSQKNTIDLFLQERVVNLFSLFHDPELTASPSDRKIHHYLTVLRQASDAFIDMGFIDPTGVQIGYAGPFGYLKGKDYSGESWYISLISQDKNYIITDIYLGFRNKPHFTVAARQYIDGQPCVLRSTLEPDRFYTFLKSIGHGSPVDSAIINAQGEYQVVNPEKGDLFGRHPFASEFTGHSGVREISRRAGPLLTAYTRLAETAWTLVVSEPLESAYAEMKRARIIITAFILMLLAIFTAVIYFLVTKLMTNALKAARQSRELQHQLIHASKLASIGEIATGVAHEINNPLAIILSTTGVIKDMFNPEFNLDSSPENVLAEIAHIETAVNRAKGITGQLLNLGRKSEPRLTLTDINTLVQDAVAGMKERELELDDIQLEFNPEPSLPEVLVDTDQMRQVIINLVNNAHDAITGRGKITISTLVREGTVHIRVEDTGKGMSPEEIAQVFNPFYTTKPTGKGTGLGLSISLNIVESMGGNMNLQSIKGRGSMFEITLPAAQP